MDGEKIIEHFQKKQEKRRISVRKLLYLSIIKDWVHKQKVLDIGCGDGMITAWLTSVCNIVGADVNTERVSKNFSNINFINFNIVKDNIHSNTADTVLFLDVMEHIPAEDENTVLRKLYLIPKKQLIISFPLKPDDDEFDRDVDIVKIIGYFMQCGMKLADYKLLVNKYVLMRFLK